MNVVKLVMDTKINVNEEPVEWDICCNFNKVTDQAGENIIDDDMIFLKSYGFFSCGHCKETCTHFHFL